MRIRCSARSRIHKNWALLKNSTCVEAFFPSPKNLLFGLEPIVQLRARLITSLDVEFVGSPLDLFFEWKRLDQGFRCTRRRWHLRVPPATDRTRSKVSCLAASTSKVSVIL